jgi:hypothetical protein
MSHAMQTKAINLLDTQKEIIKELLDQKRLSGEIRSDSEYNSLMADLLNKLLGPPISKVRPQGELTNAENFNTTFDELMLDFNVVFAQVNKIDETANKHQRLNQSVLNNLKLRIKSVQDDLTKYEELVTIKDAEQLYLETFIDSNSFEPNVQYYTDQHGTVLPIDYHAKLDTEREAIKLPSIISQNTLTGPGGVRLGTLVVNKQLGSGLIRIQNPENALDKAIDNSMDTFWGETILVDSPINVQMGTPYYDVEFGALVELEVQFDYLTQLNEIGFTAFSEYPFDIVGIKYYQTDDATEESQDLIWPTSPIEDLRNRTIEGSTAYQFQDIYAKRMRIILNQPHYVKTDYIASRKDQKNMSLWFSARSTNNINVNIDHLNVFTPVFQDKQDDNPAWEVFSDAIKGIDPDIDKILGSFDEDNMQSVTKYQYDYGLYNLFIKRNEYQTIGIHVSKEILVNGNIRSISIDTIEEHPLLRLSNVTLPRFTDIEYYISDNGMDWEPILPNTADKVMCELLTPEFINSTYQSVLRFDVVGGFVVRKNGVDVTDEVILDSDQHTITFVDFDVSSIYTAEYIPDDESRTIDYINKYTVNGVVAPRKSIQEFKGSDSKGFITLDYYPFLDRDRLNQQPLNYNPTYLKHELTAGGYLPIKVKLVDISGFHIEQPIDETSEGILVKNVTDYFNPELTALTPYDPEVPEYQYQVIGNQILFSSPIPESTKIIVEYPNLVSTVRVKTILRRNIYSFYGLTPILDNYVLKFHTLI